MLKTKKAGLATKLLILLIVVALTVMLFIMQSRIKETEESIVTYQNDIEQQTQENLALSEAIENADDPEFKKDIARQELGLLEPGEQVFSIKD